MRAIISQEPGGPETLQSVELDRPRPKAGEIAIAVRAAAVNFFDTLIIKDRYQFKPQRPFSPCGECAGIVIEVGEGVSGFALGDRVAAYIGWGGACEIVTCAASKAVVVPESVSLDHAAASLITYGTALYGLDQRGGLRAGETLVVLGASGGVGQAAVEIGAALGATVIACASSDEKVAFALEHGAHIGINTSTEDVKARLKALSAPRGVDVVFDSVGGDLVDPSIRALGWCGRYLVIGFAGGDIPALPLNLVLLKSADVRGVFWGTWTERDPVSHSRNLQRLFAMMARRQIRPHIYAEYALDDLPQALQDIAERRVMGKVIVKP